MSGKKREGRLKAEYVNAEERASSRKIVLQEKKKKGGGGLSGKEESFKTEYVNTMLEGRTGKNIE